MCGASVEVTADRVFLPFGDGPRSCEGAAPAMAEMTLVTVETACRYRFHEPPGPDAGHQVTTDRALTPSGLRLCAVPRAGGPFTG
ncbi:MULTISPECIES: cytochrome P450 [Streptomyces]|uniref:Cytochrome P450 n=1 Tax=Streptomyces ramulosus TaxID=47762 RepID=A0ABW1FS71_9ACTN